MVPLSTPCALDRPAVSRSMEMGESPGGSIGPNRGLPQAGEQTSDALDVFKRATVLKPAWYRSNSGA